MPHVLVAGKIDEHGLNMLQAAEGVTVQLVPETATEAYLPHLPAADAVLLRTQKLTEKDIAAAPRLKIVARHGVGYDAVDAKALAARQIPLAIVGDVNSRAVAEHTLMLMLAAAHNTLRHDHESRTGNWNYRNRFEAAEIDGKTLFVYGFGRIGRRVTTLAQAFGMRVQAYDPYVSSDAIAAVGASPVSDVDRAYAEADVITLHVPGLGDGPLIGEAQLALMKPTAILVNAARGGLIDEIALDKALRADQLRAAALDVLSEEPPPADHPLLTNTRVIITPHNAGLTQECARRMAIAAAQNILDHFNGKLDRKLVVNGV